jgi:hypothetical protein
VYRTTATVPRNISKIQPSNLECLTPKEPPSPSTVIVTVDTVARAKEVPPFEIFLKKDFSFGRVEDRWHPSSESDNYRANNRRWSVIVFGNRWRVVLFFEDGKVNC